jgi:hypothetical protein
MEEYDMNQEGSINPADRYVIINADDFGISLPTNQAIDDMFQSDAITSTSIMMPAPAAHDAATRCRRNKSMQVGIHFTLTSDQAGGYKPVYTKTQLTSLTTDQGFFYTDVAEFERKADPEEVRLELEAQIELALAWGIQPTHLDSHAGSVLGLFQLRDFLEVVFDLCEKYALPFCLPTGILKHPGFTDEQKQLFKRRISSAGRRGIRLMMNDLKLKRISWQAIRDWQRSGAPGAAFR